MNEQQPPESQPTPPETQIPIPQTPAPQTPKPPYPTAVTRTSPQTHSAPQPALKGPDPDFIPMEESSFSHILSEH